MAAYFPTGTTYHADSDADDEFEQRSVMTSPTQAHTDSETSSEPASKEHTPTTFGAGLDDGSRPRTIVTEWSADEVAHYINSLGLGQYSGAILDHGIDGAALTALQHDELKEMGIASAGHRLKILKGVYDLKIAQDIPLDTDDYVPQTADRNAHEQATKDDILKLTNAIIKLRDDRIAQLEQQLTKLADDSRKLRTELWPVFKMVKEREPLPRLYENSMGSPEYNTHQESMVSPPLGSAEMEKHKSSLTRSFSKKLGLSSGTPKTHSPTLFTAGNAIPEDKPPERSVGLQPSAAASAASNQLTAGMSGGMPMPHHSPNPNSPTTPAIPHQPLTARSYNLSSRYDTTVDDQSFNRNPIPTPPLQGAALNNYLESQLPSRSATAVNTKSSTTSMSQVNPPSREQSASVPPGSTRPSTSSNSQQNSKNKGEVDPEDPSVQIFKSFRVALDDPCYKVLPAALRKYNINADWRQYALYIVYGDQERCVGLEEKPLALFKDLEREAKKPMFMLRKLANGIVGDVPPAAGNLRPQGQNQAQGVGGLTSSAASIRTTAQDPRILPGGII